MKKIVLTVVALLCTFATAEAARPSAWRHRTRMDFATGKSEGVSLSPSGALSLAPALTTLADLKCGSVWDLLRNKQDRLIAATSLPGQIVRLEEKGEVTVLWKDASRQVFTLCELADGAILAGTGPNGVIYKLSPAGEVAQFAKLDCLHVWDLVAAADGAVYAATGPQGNVYKLRPDGGADLFYATKQPHVLCLALRPDGALLAGTDGAGYVMSIDPQGRGRVLYDTAEGEVRALCVLDDGSVLVATAKSTGGGAAVTANTEGEAPRPAGVGGGGAKNSVYSIDASGAVRKLAAVDGLAYAVTPRGLGGGSMPLVATGQEGALLGISPDGPTPCQLAKPDADFVLSMLAGRDGKLWLGCGNPGVVIEVSAAHRPQGTLTSKPLDAAMPARFGAIEWRCDAPAGGQVSLAVRSGNTETPDDTWSPWGIEHTEPAASAADCPTARFLQYRLTLKTNRAEASPRVEAVSVRYATSNLAPAIKSFEAPRVEEGDGKKPLDKLKLTWDAEDANGDDLSYSLRFRKPEWPAWVTLKNGLTVKEFEWDVRAVPEGAYELQLEATDAPTNPASESLTASRPYDRLLVDRTGPVVTLKLAGVEKSIASFQVGVADALTPVTAVTWSLDSGEFAPAFPGDAIFDTRSEKLDLRTAALSPGVHVLVVRAVDAAGNIGSADLVFEVPAAAP